MNRLWVRISLTYVAIVIFLFLIPTILFVTVQAGSINDAEGISESIPEIYSPQRTVQALYQNLIGSQQLGVAGRLVRILLGISFVGILVGTLSSWGLASPLQNLVVAARAVGSQDLSQRIEIRGTSEVREVAEAFNAMAEALEAADIQRNNMLADIAHELRTPLTVIQGNLRAILDDVYELDKIEMARLYDQTRQLSRLVDDLHDLSLLEADQFSLTFSDQDLGAIISDVGAIYQAIAEEQGISLNLEIQDDVSPIQGDCSRLTQCLNNLLNNALQYTPQGGEISVGLQERGDRVTITVSDTGRGIAPEHLPYVFDRFYRVDPDRNRQTGGSGLGLAITQALVEAQGGEIQVKSPGIGKGSTFVISFPA